MHRLKVSKVAEVNVIPTSVTVGVSIQEAAPRITEVVDRRRAGPVVERAMGRRKIARDECLMQIAGRMADVSQPFVVVGLGSGLWQSCGLGSGLRQLCGLGSSSLCSVMSLARIA